MLVRHVVLLILSLGLFSGCASVPPATDFQSPPQSPPVEAPPVEASEVSDSNSESQAENQAENQAEASSNENPPPKVSVKETAPEDNELQELSAIAETEPPVDVEIQPMVPQASLPDRRPDIKYLEVTPRVKFLLLSPQLTIQTSEGEAVKEVEEDVAEVGLKEPKKPGKPRKDAASDSSTSDFASSAIAADSIEASGMTAAQDGTDAQDSEEPDSIPEPPLSEKKADIIAEKESEQKAELIRAEPGEHIHLTLPGLGWIYDQGASKAQGVEFQSRNYKDSTTEFVFIAQSIGSYTLSFQQQDNRLGSSSFRTVAVDVGSPTAAVQKELPTSGAESSGVGVVGKEFSFARLEASVAAQNPSETVGQLKALLRNPLDSGVFTSGRAKQEELSLLVEAGEFLFEAKRESTAEQSLRLYLDLTEERGEHTGRVLFLLGQIYESPLPPRDERQSAEYYRKIVSFYPTDPYRQRAEQRIKYLQRHFLQIR